MNTSYGMNNDNITNLLSEVTAFHDQSSSRRYYPSKKGCVPSLAPVKSEHDMTAEPVQNPLCDAGRWQQLNCGQVEPVGKWLWSVCMIVKTLNVSPVFEELRFRRAPPSRALFYFKGGTSPGEVLRWKPVGSGGIVRRVCFFWQVSLVYSTVYCESRRRTYITGYYTT